jgi:hypothetical protein
MRFAVLLCLLAAIVTTPLGAHATGIRETRPNLVYGELGGRAVLFSAGYERYLTGRVGIGAGAFGFGSSDGGVGLFPVYLSFVPVGDVHSLYLSAGATYLAGSSWDESWGTWFGTFSVGYQYQSESGFFVRPMMTMIYKSEGFAVLPGVTMGGSF